MKSILTIIIAGALCFAAHAQAKTEKENADLLRSVQAVKVEAVEFTPKDGRGVEGRRVPVQEVTYDARGNRVKRVDFNWDGSVAQTIVYTYDASGRGTGYEEYSGVMDKPRKHVYALDESGNRIEYRIMQPDGSAGERCLYRYDTAGRLIEEILHDHKGLLISRKVYAYDGQGRQVSQTRYNADGSVSTIGTISYDAGGRFVERVRYESDVLTYRVRYVYDARGRLVEQETVGSVVELDVPPADARAPGRVRYVYNGKERPRETVEYAPDGSVREKVGIEYDSRGNWIRKTHVIQPAGSGGSESRRVEYRTITYF